MMKGYTKERPHGGLGAQLMAVIDGTALTAEWLPGTGQAAEPEPTPPADE
jgi:hypothetical protein